MKKEGVSSDCIRIGGEQKKIGLHPQCEQIPHRADVFAVIVHRIGFIVL